MALTNKPVFHILCHSGMSAHLVCILSQLGYLLFPVCEASHNILYVREFLGQSRFLHVTVELRATQGHVHLCRITADTSRHSVLNIEAWIRADEVCYTYLFSGIETDMVLFRPEFVFQNLFFCRYNVTSGFCLVKLGDFLSVLCTGFLTVLVPVGNSPPLIGIVEFTGILYVHFRVLVDDFLSQQHVYDLA